MRNYEKPALDPMGPASTTIRMLFPDPPSIDGIPAHRDWTSLQTLLEAD